MNGSVHLDQEQESVEAVVDEENGAYFNRGVGHDGKLEFECFPFRFKKHK